MKTQYAQGDDQHNKPAYLQDYSVKDKYKDGELPAIDNELLYGNALQGRRGLEDQIDKYGIPVEASPAIYAEANFKPDGSYSVGIAISGYALQGGNGKPLMDYLASGGLADIVSGLVGSYKN